MPSVANSVIDWVRRLLGPVRGRQGMLRPELTDAETMVADWFADQVIDALRGGSSAHRPRIAAVVTHSVEGPGTVRSAGADAGRESGQIADGSNAVGNEGDRVVAGDTAVAGNDGDRVAAGVAGGGPGVPVGNGHRSTTDRGGHAHGIARMPRPQWATETHHIGTTTLFSRPVTGTSPGAGPGAETVTVHVRQEVHLAVDDDGCVVVVAEPPVLHVPESTYPAAQLPALIDAIARAAEAAPLNPR